MRRAAVFGVLAALATAACGDEPAVPSSAPTTTTVTSTTTTSARVVQAALSLEVKATRVERSQPQQGFVVVDGDELVVVGDDGVVVAAGPSPGLATNHQHTPFDLTIEGDVIRIQAVPRAPLATPLFPADCDAELVGLAPNVARCGEAHHPRRIEVREERRSRVLIETPPRTEGMTGEVLGFWRSVELSPDGAWVLAQWSGECESPTAFLLPYDDGAKGTTVDGTPLTSWTDAPSSVPAGWTADGRARFVVGAGACGSGLPVRGVYGVAPGGRPTVLYRATADFPTAHAWRRPPP